MPPVKTMPLPALVVPIKAGGLYFSRVTESTGPGADDCCNERQRREGGSCGSSFRYLLVRELLPETVCVSLPKYSTSVYFIR